MDTESQYEPLKGEPYDDEDDRHSNCSDQGMS